MQHSFAIFLKPRIKIFHYSALQCSSEITQPRVPDSLRQNLLIGKQNVILPPIQNSLNLGRSLAESGISVTDFSNYYMIPNQDQSARNIVDIPLKNLEELFQEVQLLKNDPSNKRISDGFYYFNCLFKISEILEQRVQSNLEPILLTSDTDRDLQYLQWLTYFMNGKFETSQRIFLDNADVLLPMILDDFYEFAKRRTHKNKTQSKRQSRIGVPKLFHVENINEFTENLIITIGKDDLTNQKILSLKALALWNSGHFSEGLSTIATVLNYLMKEFDQFEPRAELGKYSIAVLSMILKDISSKNLTPAIKFLDVVMDKCSLRIPLLPYVISLHYQTNEELREKVKEIFDRYPSINEFKHLKFEKAIMADDTTISDESKAYFIQDMLRNIDSNLLNGNNETKDPKQQITTDVVDIKVCELLQANLNAEAFKYIGAEAKRGILPSLDVLNLVIENFKDSSDDLSRLRSKLPIETEWYDLVTAAEIRAKHKEIHSTYKKGERFEALELLLKLYVDIAIEVQYPATEDISKLLLEKTKKLLRIYMEESAFQNNVDVKFMGKIYEFSANLVRKYQHYHLQALYWDIYFFSPDENYQGYAEKLIMDNPELAKYLNFSYLVDRADRYKYTSIHHKLVEISLKYGDENAKKITLNSLVRHYCYIGKLNSALETVELLENLGISLTDEAMHDLQELKNEVQLKKEGGIFYQITDAFKNLKPNKK